jgi:hypothetical protein
VCNSLKLFKCLLQASKDGILVGRKCLVLVGCARKFTLYSSLKSHSISKTMKFPMDLHF